MRLLMCVHGPEDVAASQFALLSLTPDYARQMLRRREAAGQLAANTRELGQFWTLAFWDDTMRWLGADPEIPQTAAFRHLVPPETDCETMEDLLDLLVGSGLLTQVQRHQHIIELPGTVLLPDALTDATEMGRVEVEPRGAR